MTVQELIQVLPELTKAKVKSFKWAELEIQFHVEQEQADATKQVIEALKKQEEQLPVDLRTDNINSFDSVLNWSASPDQNQPDIPGTGDQPL